ncbi:MAG: threonine aldolase [Flavobacteriales bacterium]|nr:threonine aldolase [Flavobacteriales bacterium]
MVDLRSDTVTRPTAAMRQAMLTAEVGDDVYGEDPTVRALEERVAGLFGMEAGLFCPSGTMSNQIALAVHTRPSDEVICDEGAHIYRYEGGGLMANSGVSVRLLKGDRGRFTAAMVRAERNDPNDPHAARTKLVSIENTCNRGGGSCWDLQDVRAIRSATEELGLALHMDGARIFNALVARSERAADWGAWFDSVSVCLSKGLGAPVGSVLLGSRPFISEARRVRKRLGGGMRQAGILAAAGLHALDHHVDRLAEDHARAASVADLLGTLPGAHDVLAPETNIVIYRVHGDARSHVLALRERGVLAHPIGPEQVRLVFHLDITAADMDMLKDALKRVLA